MEPHNPAPATIFFNSARWTVSLWLILSPCWRSSAESRFPMRTSTPETFARSKRSNATLPRTRAEAAKNRMKAYITGSGAHLPDRVVTNEELADKLGLEAERIFKSSGIKARRWADA